MNATAASQSRYLNLFSDRAFRRMFGSERDKGITLSLLNALLENTESITDFQLVSTAYIPDNPADRGIVLDLQCLTADGRRIVVELQKRQQTFFRERTLFYSTWPIQSQGKPFDLEKSAKANWDYNFKAVYVISLLDFALDKHSADTRIVSRKMIRDVETNETWTDRLVFVNVELSRFQKRLDECEGLLDKWFFVLKNLHRLLEQPLELQENVFSHLFEIADKSRFDPGTREDYEQSEEEYDHMKNALDYAIRDGLAQGMAQGMAQGIAQGMAQGLAEGKELDKLDVIDSMLSKGCDWTFIESITHLNQAGYEALKTKHRK